MDFRFSEHFLQALEQARDEALRTGRRGILPDHVTLGILRLDGSPASEILRRLGLDPAELKRQLDDALFQPQAIPWQERESILPCESTVSMMQHAAIEARRCGSALIEPLHFLLACTRVSGNRTHDWLQQHGISLQQLVEASGLDWDRYGLDKSASAPDISAPDPALMASAIEKRLLEGYTTTNPLAS